MKQEEKNNEILFPSYETLGDITAPESRSRRTWRLLLVGFLLSGVMMAAMLPVLLEQKTRDLQQGPVEDRMIQAMRWWGERMTSWKVDLPALRLRGQIEEISQADWQTTYCAFQSLGIFGENSGVPRNLEENDEALFKCE